MKRQATSPADVAAIVSSETARTDSITLIRARCADEAKAAIERRLAAGMMGSLALNDLEQGKLLRRTHGGHLGERNKRVVTPVRSHVDADELRVSRDPCPKCGVREDYHARLGCARWRGR